MSWIRSSRSVALVAVLALAVAAVGPAAAISVSAEDVPDESQVGETVSTTIVVEDPFQDMPDTWTLRGETELTNVSWTVTVLQQGNQVSQEVYGNASFEQELNFDNGGDTIRIELTGDAPAIDNYSYDPPQAYTLYSLEQVTGSNAEGLDNASVHHYTQDSQQARNAIDDADAAIDQSGGNQEAQDLLDSAVSSYNNGNFDNAERLAGNAQEQAQQAQQSQETMQLALYGVGALIVLALIGGGIYYWRSQQDDYSRLQ